MAQKAGSTTVATNDAMPVPKSQSRSDFARRLYKLMVSKGWRQSELARRANLPRDSISTYMRAKVLPTSESLRKLAAALGVETTDILPNYIERAVDVDAPMVEMKVSPNEPNKAWLRVNQLVPLSVAAEIIVLLQKHVGENDTAV